MTADKSADLIFGERRASDGLKLKDGLGLSLETAYLSFAVFNKSTNLGVRWVSGSEQHHAEIKLRPLRLFRVSVERKFLIHVFLCPQSAQTFGLLEKA